MSAIALTTVAAGRTETAALHTRILQFPAALVVGKGGLKIKEAAPEKEPGVGGGLNVRINNDGSGGA
jgi:hypothetical protein